MVTISRSDDVRVRNRQRVIAAVRRGSAASRTDISTQTGLSAATVAAITSDLIDEGVLKTLTIKPPDHAVAGRGRPQVALTMNPEFATVCAVYFQLNFISASIVDYSGEIIAEYLLERVTKDFSPEEINEALTQCINGALEKARAGDDRIQLRRIEVGFQGVTDVAGTQVLWTPICHHHEIPIQAWLENHFGVAAHVANDCDLIAQALHWQQPEKYSNNFATVLLAHGVGMGLFLRGDIINGIWSSGVEFGHMNYIPDGALCRCGNRGCIEAYAGDYAIQRHAQGITETAQPLEVMESSDLFRVAEAAAEGDKNALDAIEKAGSAIGTGLASLFAIVDAFPVVLVGRGARLYEFMEPAIRHALERAPGNRSNLNIEISCFEDEQPLVREGCALKALLAHDAETAARRRHNEAAE